MLNYKKRKKLRQLKHELGNHYCSYGMLKVFHGHEKAKSLVMNSIKYTAALKKSIFSKPYQSILDLKNELNLSDDDFILMWMDIDKERRQRKLSQSLKPIRERKDNKNTLNTGGSGTGKNSIRYPSKKRSKYTWRRFYKLFPWIEQDKKLIK